MSSLPPDSLLDQDAPARSLVQALRDEPIEPAQIDLAYTRFLRQRAAAAARWRGPRVVRYAALAVLMAVGTVYAATLIERPSRTRLPTEKKEIAEAPAPRPRSLPAPPPAIALEENTPPPTEAPSLEPASAEPAAVAAPASGREQPAYSPAPVASAEQWRRAAQGLRDGDYRSANAALEQLTRSGSEAERESALLVQAQVLIAQGRTREAQQLLKVLEGSARAPSVRRKAVELLVRLRDRPAAAASEKPRGVSRPP